MSLMFFISGLFVVPNIERNGEMVFLRERAKRLGVPFLFGMIFLSPLAYYPSFLLTGSDKSYPAYWLDMILVGPWPTGPLWFISMLMVFNLFVPPTYWFIQRYKIQALFPAVLFRKFREEPLMFFLISLVFCIASYLPLYFIFGPYYWLFFGPFCFNVSRSLLYFSNFGLGVCLGARGLQATFLDSLGTFGRRWPLWFLFSGVFFIWSLLANKSMLEHYIPLKQIWNHPPGWLSNGLAFSTCTATISLAALALFQRFPMPQSRLLYSLRANAYGIYLIHYPLVVWTQYFLLGWPMGAIAKATIVFGVSLSGSWVLIALFRRIPAIGKII